jgi:hypothetical protein
VFHKSSKDVGSSVGVTFVLAVTACLGCMVLIVLMYRRHVIQKSWDIHNQNDKLLG